MKKNTLKQFALNVIATVTVFASQLYFSNSAMAQSDSLDPATWLDKIKGYIATLSAGSNPFEGASWSIVSLIALVVVGLIVFSIIMRLLPLIILVIVGVGAFYLFVLQ